MSCSFPVQSADSVMTVSGPGTEHVAEDGELIWSYFLHNSDYIIGRCDLLLKKKKRSELFTRAVSLVAIPQSLHPSENKGMLNKTHSSSRVSYPAHVISSSSSTHNSAHFLLDFSAIVFDDDLRSDAFTWDYFTVRVHLFFLYSLFSFSSLLRTHFCWLLGHFCGDFTSLLCRNYAQ